MNHTVDSIVTPPDACVDECVELGVLARVNGWDTDYRQVSGGKFESQLGLYSSSRLRFTDHRCNQEMLIAGTPPPGHIGVVIPLNPRGKGVFQSQTLGVNQLAIIGQQSGIQLQTPDDLRMLVVTIPVSRLSQSLATTADRGVDNDLAQSRIITLNRRVLADIEAPVSRAIQLGHYASHQDSLSVCLHEIEDHFIGSLCREMTAPVALERGARGRGNRLRYLSRARNFINENPGAVLSLESIALAVETSPRTLEVAFREALNVTVVQYIKYSRLNAVRRQLLKYRGSQVKVKSLALDHGFWHLSRFAQDYYSLFNEHPSQTLGHPQPCPDRSAA